MKLPFWATSLTIIGIAVLIGLGTWQLHRLNWKTALLAQIEIEQNKNPMSFELTGENLTDLRADQIFVRGFTEGIYLHNKEIALAPRTYNGKPGYHIITPFETLDSHIILVNRGWVPMDMKESGFSRPDGSIIITGTARKPEKPNLFVPDNDPAQNAWYRLDITDIAKAKDLSAIIPYILYADNDDKNSHPLAIATKWQPHNKHLGYALFWFNMAGVLLIIYYFRFIHSKAPRKKH